MVLHNDEPTLLDRLDRIALVREVAKHIATCDPPQVFGIHGDWGLGKTSFLQQLQCELTGTCPARTDKDVGDAKGTGGLGKNQKEYVVMVWFEAWRYQNEPAPVVALLHEMRSQLAWYAQLMKKMDKAAEVLFRGALLSLEELTKKIGIQASKFEAAEEKWERDNLANVLPSHTIREHLNEAIKKLLPGRADKKRLVVLIDDLDRCAPQAAFRLLEGLKLYLTLDNCVFVLGMNQKIIEEAVGGTMPCPGTGSAETYLEKLYQNVWRLPRVGDPKKLLLDLLPDTDIRHWIDAAIGDSPCLPPNPRRIKGFANLILRFQEMLPEQTDARSDETMILQARLMFIVAYVYQFHHDLYIRWEASPDLFDRISEWTRGEDVSGVPILDGLTLPLKAERDASTPEVRTSFSNAFLDPTDPTVFWIQQLVSEVSEKAGPNDFLRYLRGSV